MDTALPLEERQQIEGLLVKHCQQGLQYHKLRTRQAGALRFVSVHILVPGNWTVNQGHKILEQIELEIRDALPNTTVLTHLEALDEEVSWEDQSSEREPLASARLPLENS
jgi:divalent metal cation (Fe/Co/Zn/Cd) transporter